VNGLMGLISIPTAGMEVEDWWNSSLQVTSAENRNRVAAVLIYTAWNVLERVEPAHLSGCLAVSSKSFGFDQGRNGGSEAGV
jgi:hypothetical protein